MKRIHQFYGAMISVAAVAVGTPAWANDDAQLWTGGNVTVQLSDHWRLSQESTAQFSNHKNGL